MNRYAYTLCFYFTRAQHCPIRVPKQKYPTAANGAFQ